MPTVCKLEPQKDLSNLAQEWKKYNLTFHVMRDNPAHGTHILGFDDVILLLFVTDGGAK
jgi:hypothetical protein